MKGILPDKHGDWRIEASSELAADAVLPSGTAVPAGAVVQKISIVCDAERGQLAFPTPHPAALLMSASISAAGNAHRLRSEVQWEAAPDGLSSASSASTPLLFDAFQSAMVAAVFAFQSIESFLNHSIWTRVTAPLSVSRRNKAGKVKISRLPPEQLERVLSTDEKLTLVMPQILARDITAHAILWAQYQDLKVLRDTVVHLKGPSHYVRDRPDDSSIYYKLLRDRPLTYPRIGLAVIRYLEEPTPSKWVDLAQTYIGQLGAN